MIEKSKNKRWFSLDGYQHGARKFEDRIQHLDLLKNELGNHDGVSVLDIGCAEGLIAKWLIDVNTRNSVIHGLESRDFFIERCYRFVSDIDVKEAEYFIQDISKPIEAPLLNQYDVVLMLAVAHKLKREAEHGIRFGLFKTRRWFAITMPRTQGWKKYVDERLTTLFEGFILCHKKPLTGKKNKAFLYIFEKL